MNIKDLVTEVSKKTGFTKRDIQLVITTTFETIAHEVLEEGDSVTIAGFGSFKPKEVKGVVRIGPKANRGKEYHRKTIKLVPSKKLKKDI